MAKATKKQVLGRGLTTILEDSKTRQVQFPKLKQTTVLKLKFLR